MEVNRVIGRATLAQAVVMALAFCGAALAQPRPQATVHGISQAQARVVTVNIPAQSLASALVAFATQTGLQIVYASPKRLVGLTSPGFHGKGTVGNVLDELLRTSRLTYAFVNERTVTVRARGATLDPAQAAGDPQPTSGTTTASGPITTLSKNGRQSTQTNSPFDQSNANPASPSSAPQNPQKLGAIVVTGQFASLARSEATKRSAVNIVDSVSAEEVGKFPDQNVADALQRVPGVSVDRGGGQSNHVTVRGFGPTFVKVLLNGRAMATASSDRAFDFNVLPSEIIQQALVYKTSMADLPVGGIGGTINIVTSRPLDFNGWHATARLGGVIHAISGSHRTSSFLRNKVTPQFSGMLGSTTKDGTFGWLVSVMYLKRDYVQQAVRTHGWQTGLSYTDIDPSLTNVAIPHEVEERYTQTPEEHRSIDAALEWQPTKQLLMRFNTLYTAFRQNKFLNLFNSFTNATDIKSLTADANGTALQFTRFDAGVLANDYLVEYQPNDTVNEQTGLHIDYVATPTMTIGFDTSISKAWNKPKGNGLEVDLGTRNIGVNPVWTNNGPNRMSSYSNLISTTNINALKAHQTQVAEQSDNVSNEILTNKLTLSKTFFDGPLSALHFGVSHSRNQKRVVQWNLPGEFGCVEYCGYIASVPGDAVDAHVLDVGTLVGSYAPGAPTSWVTYNPWKLLDYLLTPAAYTQPGLPDPSQFLAQLTAAGGGWNASPNTQTFSDIKERDLAAYVMAKFDGSVGDHNWQLNVGVRYTKTHTTSSGFATPVLSIHVNPHDTSNAIPTFGSMSPVSVKSSYHEWLPSFNFKFNITDDVIFRAAASKTLTRPNLSNLRISRDYDFRPHEQTLSEGNVNLKPFIAKNYDVGIGWYINNQSYIATDYFFKKVTNFTTLITHEEEILGFPFQVTNPINLNNAIIKGAEATANYKFDGLPSPFDGLGVAVNYTYVTSSADLGPTQIVNGGGRFAVPGIGNSYNASLFYAKGPVQVRFAWNWRSAYLSSVSGEQGQPTTVKSYGQLDFSGIYTINTHFSVYLQAQNINNEKIYNYQVFLNRENYGEADGRTLFFGVRWTLQ